MHITYPVRQNADGSFDECDESEATAFGLYERLDDGLLTHIRDYPTAFEAQIECDRLNAA